MLFKRIRAIVPALFLLSLLAACGGGGGAGGGEGAGGGGGGVSVSPNGTALQFSGIAGESIAAQQIDVTLTSASGTVYGAADASDSSVATAAFNPTGSTTAAITVTPSSSRAPGVYQTTVFLRIYRNANGTDLLGTFSYPVTLTVLPGLAVNPTAAALNALEGQSTQTQLALSVPPGATGAVVAALAPGQAAAPWLSLTVLGNGSVQVDASAASLPAGVYQRELEISVPRSNGTASLRVPLTFTVGVGLVAPAEKTLLLRVDTPLANLAGSVNVARADGASSAWTATSSAPWLVLASGSGTTPGTLDFSVNAAQAALLPQFADSTATVTITSADLTPVSFAVTLQKRLPYLSAAGPYGLPTNTPVRIVLGGRGFSQVGDPTALLTASGLSVSSVDVLSDSQVALNVTVPPGAVSYTLAIFNVAGIPTPAATLVVSEPFSYAPATVPHAGAKNIYLHDPVRRAVFALSRSGNALVRYQFANNAWSTTSVPHIGTLNMAFASDGSRIWLTDSSNRVVEVDPDGMTVHNQYVAPFGIAQNLGGTLPVSSDGRLWLPGGAHYFDLLTRTFQTFDANPGNIEFGAYHGTLDGSLVMISPSWQFSPLAPYAIYEPVNGLISSPMGNTELGYEPRFSIDGSRTLHEFTGRLYNRSFALLGQVPTPPDVDSHQLMTLTPDGSKILVLRKTYTNASQTTLSSQAIDIYSTTAFAAGTTEFLKIGSLPISVDASLCAPSSNDSFYGNQYLLPSVDSKTLFWIGNQSMQVFSIP